MGRIGRRIRRGLRKVARGLGKAATGPVGAGAEAARAKRKGKSWREAAKDMTDGLHPGSPIKDTIDGTAEVTGAVVSAVDNKAGQRLETFLKAPVANTTSPTDAMEDRVRIARDLDGATGTKQIGRLIGKGVAGSALTGVGGVLETGSAYWSVRGVPVPRDLKAALARVFRASIDFDSFTVRGGRMGRPGGKGERDATALPHIIFLGRDSAGNKRSMYLKDAAGNNVALPNLTAEEASKFGFPQFKPTSLFIHELVHIWQYQQSGSDYMANALYQQIVLGDGTTGGEAYDWQTPLLAHPGREWLDLREEAQAEMIQDAFDDNLFDVPTVVDGTVINFAWMPPPTGTDFGPRLREAVKNLHRGKASG